MGTAIKTNFQMTPGGDKATTGYERFHIINLQHQKKLVTEAPTVLLKHELVSLYLCLQYSTKKLSCLLSNLRKDKVFFSSFRKSLYTLDKVIKTIENLNN